MWSLRHTSHMASALQPHVISDYRTGQHRQRTFPPLQKAGLGSAFLEASGIRWTTPTDNWKRLVLWYSFPTYSRNDLWDSILELKVAPSYLKGIADGMSLAVQWIGLCTSTAGDRIPSPVRSQIRHAVWCGQKNLKKKKEQQI